MKKDENNPINIVKEGYKPIAVTPTKKMDPWFWGNIIFGGLFGSTTDGMTGAIDKFAPDSYFVTLEPESGAARKVDAVFTSNGEDASVKQFILVSYQQLSENISAGTGPYLDTLISKLNVAEDQKAKAIDTLKGLLTSASGNIIDFADGVMKSLYKATNNSSSQAPVAPSPTP